MGRLPPVLRFAQLSTHRLALAASWRSVCTRSPSVCAHAHRSASAEFHTDGRFHFGILPYHLARCDFISPSLFCRVPCLSRKLRRVWARGWGREL
ncbi:hypothetical protein C8R45DRAFT_1040423 [Mycena sanguinolenta]|nr:hypothetical protein C8R45DRAFT_1040423 [Mycena sanguinolenta]